MSRREFIAAFGAAASPSNSYDQSLVEAFRLGLRDLGVVENRHVVLDVVWINSEPEIPQAVNELMERGAPVRHKRVSSGEATSVNDSHCFH